MNVKLAKITKSFMKQNFYYTDFLFEDIGLLIKGIIYNHEKKTLIFPIIKTEGGRNFMPLTFPIPEKSLWVRAKMVELINENPLPEIEEDVVEKIKAAKLLRAHNLAIHLAKKEANRGKKPAFNKKGFKGAQKPPGSSFKNGIGSYTPPARKPAPAPVTPLRGGFSEVSLPKKWGQVK